MDQQNPFLEQEIDLREYLRVISERRWIIISITIVLCTLSLIRSFMTTPVYIASTNILIQKNAPRVVNVERVDPSERFVDLDYYKTQHKILRSRSLTERVDKALGGYKPWDKWLGKESTEPLSSTGRMKALLGSVAIKPIPNTRLTTIAVEDSNPVQAAKIANLWAENYISYVLDTKFDTMQYASGWLQAKIEEAKAKLERSETALQDYRGTHKILATDKVNAQGTMLDQLLEKKSKLEIELSEQLEYYKEKHPEMIGVRSELASVDRKIDTERSKELKTKDKEIKYNMLAREVDINREMYRSLLKSISEAEVTEGLKTSNIRIIDKAIVPEKPSKPNKRKDLLMALFMGLVGGIGLAFLFEGLDQSIKTPEDIKKHLKLPALASVPMPKDAEDKTEKPEFITLSRARSTISESYRSLRTSILFTAVENKRKVLLFTSSGPQEGKTTTAINTAIVMAQSGERTILVDADLRKPRIEEAFDINPECGLTEVLADTKDLDAAIRKTELENLDLLPCGTIPPNPSELLSSIRMDVIIGALEERYDRIIIDTPPVLAVTDAVVLSGKVDGSIIVVKAGQTHRHAVQKTKEILESMPSINIIGCVLNMVENARTGGYYYYHQYYGKHGKYGQDNKKKSRRKRKKQEVPSDE